MCAGWHRRPDADGCGSHPPAISARWWFDQPFGDDIDARVATELGRQRVAAELALGLGRREARVCDVLAIARATATPAGCTSSFSLTPPRGRVRDEPRLLLAVILGGRGLLALARQLWTRVRARALGLDRVLQVEALLPRPQHGLAPGGGGMIQCRDHPSHR